MNMMMRTSFVLPKRIQFTFTVQKSTADTTNQPTNNLLLMIVCDCVTDCVLYDKRKEPIGQYSAHSHHLCRCPSVRQASTRRQQAGDDREEVVDGERRVRRRAICISDDRSRRRKKENRTFSKFHFLEFPSPSAPLRGLLLQIGMPANSLSVCLSLCLSVSLSVYPCFFDRWISEYRILMLIQLFICISIQPSIQIVFKGYSIKYLNCIQRLHRFTKIQVINLHRGRAEQQDLVSRTPFNVPCVCVSVCVSVCHALQVLVDR